MAKTYVQEGRHLSLALAGRSSGDVAVKGTNLTGVCTNDTDSDGNVTVDSEGVYDLYVNGVDGSGNSAIVVGDALYASGAGAQGSGATVLSKNAGGTLFGYALEAGPSGAITLINVKLAQK